MDATNNFNHRIPKMTFASVYPLYRTKVEKKGRSVEDLRQVIGWLTGFDEAAIARLIAEQATFEQLFEQAQVHPNAALITGSICGLRVEQIDDPLVQTGPPCWSAASPSSA